MMALGSGGSGAAGNSSSSTSSLSASAPPFTVDRFNPKPSANPLLGYSESPFTVEPFSHGWQYPTPSAPRPEMLINSSTGMTSRPLSDDFGFSNSGTVSPSTAHWSVLSPGGKTLGSASAFGGDIKSYYSPYVPSTVGEDNHLVKVDGPCYSVVPASGVNVSYQTNCNQSFFDWDCAPGRVDALGFNDGKRAKRVEPDGIFSSEKANVGGSHSYQNQVNQGGYGIEYGNKSPVHSVFSYENFNHVSDGVLHTGPLGVGQKKDYSCLEKNRSFIPYESNATQISAASSTSPDCHPLDISCEFQSNFPNYQIPYNRYDKCVDSSFPDPRSIRRSSPAVVIRPPPAPSSNSRQGIIFGKPSRSDNDAGDLTMDFDRSYPPRPKDHGLKQTTEIREDSCNTNLFNYSDNGQFFISTSLEKELSSPLHDANSFDHKIKAKLGSQSPVTHVSGVFDVPSGSVQVGKSTEDSSDFTDYHSIAVDSPCWKGAPFSQFSHVDVEAGNSDHLKKPLSENHGFLQEAYQNLDSTKTLVDMANEFNENDENNPRKNVASAVERTPDEISSNREQSIPDNTKAGFRFSAMASRKGMISSDQNMPGKEYGLPNNLKSGFDMNVSDTKHFACKKDVGMALNDVAEGGDIAVHAAEKVLASPPSQEDASRQAKLQQEPKFDGPTMIKAIHNLSELLLFNLSNDLTPLEDDDTETLKHIISNLDACMSYKIVKPTDRLGPKYHVGDTSEKLGESCDLGATSGGPLMSKGAEVSHPHLDYQHIHEQKKKYSFAGEREEKSVDCSPLTDELDSIGDEDMVKDIKKVLEENFSFSEEMPSQSRLFKSLWLEAEAKLCSISYKARFDRMKIEMEKIKAKAPPENVDVAKMMSGVCISPNLNKVSEVSHDSVVPETTAQNSSIPSTGRYVDDVEASVMARFNILKSREENPTPRNKEEDEQKSHMVGNVSDSIMSRFNILKSREEKLTPTNVEEEQESQIVGAVADSIMSRFNILKSREENLKLICTDGELQSHMAEGESTGKKNQSEDETINVSLKSYFMHPAGGIREGKFGSFVNGSGYESLKENASATKDPVIHSFDNSRMTNEHYSGWRGSPTSDWEHVQKDDLVWKKL